MDQFTDNVFRAAGKIIYKKDLILEHIHPGCFRERMDETFGRLEQVRPKDAGWEVCQPDLNRCIKILHELCNS